MQDVKIVDIDNVQWNMKDQEARNKIANLETEIPKLKTVEKWQYTIPNYGGSIVARRQGNVVSVVGTNIGVANTIPSTVGNIDFAILPERFRPKENCFFMMRIAGSYITQYGGTIFTNGTINFYTYTNVTEGYFSLSYIVD